MITVNDIIRIDLSKDELNDCIDNAQMVLRNLLDREDLHERDDLERFHNILIGEIAEKMVLKWLLQQGKRAISTVDKSSGLPDAGHDIELLTVEGKVIQCSVKSSLSFKMGLEGIIQNFKLASTKSEIREVNIQVYFWLDLTPPNSQSRTSVPTVRNSAIIGWFGANDLNSFEAYKHEQRMAPTKPLKTARPMSELLKYIE